MHDNRKELIKDLEMLEKMTIKDTNLFLHVSRVADLARGNYYHMDVAMKKYKVTYAEHVLREIEVSAKSQEEAADIVRSGNADYDTAIETAVELCDVTRVEEL